MVAFGTLLSAFWILAVNSWMQTPAGYTIGAGRPHFLPADWWAIVFNPSFSVALAAHGAGGLPQRRLRGRRASRAWHLLRDRATPAGAHDVLHGDVDGRHRRAVQIVVGDMHGLNTLEYQPAKIAAMEGDWEPRTAARR